jgi:hypothetical protein
MRDRKAFKEWSYEKKQDRGIARRETFMTSPDTERSHLPLSLYGQILHKRPEGSCWLPYIQWNISTSRTIWADQPFRDARSNRLEFDNSNFIIQIKAVRMQYGLRFH